MRPSLRASSAPHPDPRQVLQGFAGAAALVSLGGAGTPWAQACKKIS